MLKNPTSLVRHPDFLQWNPEFELAVDTTGDRRERFVVEEPNSDAAQVFWQWVLSDPEAKEWLDGTPDRGVCR